MITIKDIAAAAGVSVSTVSRVLNNRPDVSEASSRKVQEAIERYHYMPNASARDLVGQETDGIGLVMRGAGNPFYTEVFRAIQETCRERGQSLVVSQIPSLEDEITAGASLARARRLKGLILLGGRFDYRERDILALGVPVTCCSFTNMFTDLPPDVYSSVSIDDEETARRAVSRVIEAGHAEIAILLAATDDHSISELRYRGYRRALDEAGLPFREELVARMGDYSMASAYKAARRLLAREMTFTALFAIADTAAMAAIRAFHDLGRRVPDDLSVVAIDGLELSGYGIPALTTMVQPTGEMGRRAVEQLVGVTEGNAKNRQILLETTFRPGESLKNMTT